MVRRLSQVTRLTPGLLLLALSLLACRCDSSYRDPTATYPLAELQRDFRQVRTLIDEKHPHSFTDPIALAAAFDRQYALLRDGMTSPEFLRVLAPAVSKVRCGHTRLYYPRSVGDYLVENGHYLPFEIHAFADGTILVLRSYFTDDPVVRGSTLLSINGVDAGQILTRMADCLPADGVNETFKYFSMNVDFRSIYHDCIEGPESFSIVVRDPDDGTETTRVVEAMTEAEIRSFKAERSIVDPHPPLIETSFAEDPRYAVLRIRFFDFDDDLDAFAERMRGFFERLDDSGTHSLILDLRGNDGGGPYGAAHLLGYLIGRPFRYYSPRSTFLLSDLKKTQAVPEHAFHGALYVLIDGGSYSTTGHVISLLKQHAGATFIGEESGGSFACNGGFKEFRLRNTGIDLLLPHATFIADVQFLPRGRGILPDRAVEPGIADLLNGTDPAMETAVELIRSAGR